MEALIMGVWRLVSAVVMSISLMSPVSWCDSCGELYSTDDMTVIEYETHSAEMCWDCLSYWGIEVI